MVLRVFGGGEFEFGIRFTIRPLWAELRPFCGFIIKGQKWSILMRLKWFAATPAITKNDVQMVEHVLGPKTGKKIFPLLGPY